MGERERGREGGRGGEREGEREGEKQADRKEGGNKGKRVRGIKRVVGRRKEGRADERGKG